jgi:hypothetical protein
LPLFKDDVRLLLVVLAQTFQVLVLRVALGLEGMALLLQQVRSLSVFLYALLI